MRVIGDGFRLERKARHRAGTEIVLDRANILDTRGRAFCCLPRVFAVDHAPESDGAVSYSDVDNMRIEDLLLP